MHFFISYFGLLLLPAILAFKTTLQKGGSQCFFISLPKDGIFSVSFHGISADTDEDEVCLSLSSPSGKLLQGNIPEGPFSYSVAEQGDFTYCFHNNNPNEENEVIFNVNERAANQQTKPGIQTSKSCCLTNYF